MMLETLESPLDCKEIQPVNPKGNQSWIFCGRTYAEVKALILWPPDAKSWLIRKDPDAGKDWRQEEKGMTEDEMVGWHHRLNEHEFEQAPGNGEEQGSLACCSPWGHKESDTTERLNNSNILGWGQMHLLPPDLPDDQGWVQWKLQPQCFMVLSSYRNRPDFLPLPSNPWYFQKW